MVLSESKKFLFIHIPKCAGESMTHVLKPYALDYLKVNTRFTEYIKDRGQLPVHLTYQDISDSVKVNLNDYYLFAFVRNPWERYVSLYAYFRRMERHIMHQRCKSQFFSEFINDVVEEKTLISHYNLDSRPQTDYIRRSQFLKQLDFIGRVENLDKDFDLVCRRLDIENPGLSKLNMDSHEPYQTYYSNLLRDKVTAYCREEIEVFGYTY